MADDHLRGDGRRGLQLVQAFGDLQEFSRDVESVQEPVHQEDNSGGGSAVPDKDGGSQGRLQKRPQDTMNHTTPQAPKESPPTEPRLVI